MAFLPEDEENQQNQDPNAGASGQILGGPSAAPIGGGAAPSAGSAAPATASGASPKGTASGSFTNLNNYITANKGNDAAMGSAVKGTVSSAAGKADTAGATYQQTATDAVNAATVKDDAGYTGTLANMANPGTPSPGRGKYQQGTGGAPRAAQPTATSAQPKARGPQQAAAAPATTTPALDNETFTKLYNAEYTGPNAGSEVEGYADAGSAFNKVQSYGQKAGANSDIMSRGELLQDTYGQGGQQYRGGEKTLDSFILGGGEQGAAALGDINQTYGNYGSNFENINALIGGAIDQGKATTDATRNAFQTAAKDAHGRLEGSFAAATKEANDANFAAKAKAAALAAGDANAWGKAGVTAEDLAWAKSQGINLSKLVASGGGFNTGDFVKAPQKADYSNLMSMLNSANAGVSANYDNTDLTAAGGTKTAGNTKSVAALTSLSKNFAPLQQKAAAETKARQETVNILKEQLSPFAGSQGLMDAAKTLGVPENVLAEARKFGIDPGAYLAAGNAVDAGDLGGGEYAGLLKLIGVSPKALGDGQPAGPAFSFDTQGLLAAIQAARPAKGAGSQAALAKAGQAGNAAGGTVKKGGGKSAKDQLEDTLSSAIGL